MIDNTMTEPSSNPCQLTDDLLPGLRITTKFGTSVLFKSTELRKGDVVYPADQIRAYGDARAAAATERAAQVCDEHASIEGIAQKCAAAIRASAMPAPEPGAVTGTRHIARSPVSPTDAP